jgi:hypothetical protein
VRSLAVIAVNGPEVGANGLNVLQDPLAQFNLRLQRTGIPQIRRQLKQLIVCGPQARKKKINIFHFPTRSGSSAKLNTAMNPPQADPIY